MPISKEYLERNIERVPISGCWLWTGYCNPDGYAQRKIHGVTYRFHRVSYSLYIGDIGNNHVLHTCDIPSCVNPNHLFLGTHSDNMADMWKKRRHPSPKKGTGSTKLTLEQVRKIRAIKGRISALQLSKQYSVNAQTISNIWNGTTWTGIE